MQWKTHVNPNGNKKFSSERNQKLFTRNLYNYILSNTTEPIASECNIKKKKNEENIAVV